MHLVDLWQRRHVGLYHHHHRREYVLEECGHPFSRIYDKEQAVLAAGTTLNDDTLFIFSFLNLSLIYCAIIDNIFFLLLSSSSLQGGTSPLQVPPSMSYYFHHQKPSGIDWLYEPAVHLSCLKHNFVVDTLFKTEQCVTVSIYYHCLL